MQGRQRNSAHFQLDGKQQSGDFSLCNIASSREFQIQEAEYAPALHATLTCILPANSNHAGSLTSISVAILAAAE